MKFGIVASWEYFAKDTVTVAKQIVRSAESIGTNIAEAFGRFTIKQIKTFVISAGSHY